MKQFLSGSEKLVRRILVVGGPIVLAVMVAVVYAWLDKPGDNNAKPNSSVATSFSAEDVKADLSKLAVAGEMPMTGYSREKFPHWDTDKPEHGFGSQFAQYERCTTREVMMLRDATGTVTLDPKTCDLKVGKDGGWRDQYGVLDRKTGKLKPYKWITEPKGVDAEHIVALAEAWRSGAQKLDENTRRRIANDAINLVASDPSANRSKGDQDAANYLPPGNFRCAYIARYLQIKIKYSLTADAAEKTALQKAVDDCTSGGGFR